MGYAGLAMGSSVGAMLNAALLLRSLSSQGAYAINPRHWASLCARLSASASCDASNTSVEQYNSHCAPGKRER